MADSVFFLTALQNSEQVDSRLATLVQADDRYQLAPDKWMVAFAGGARELAEKVGVRGTEGVIGNGLVLPVTGYSGRAPTDLWEWLKKKGL